MNSLSWLIYAADALESFGTLLTFVGVLLTGTGILGFALGYLARGLYASEWNDRKDDNWKEDWQNWFNMWDRMRGWLVFGLLALVFVVLIPSKNTIYAIATSEVGERIATSDTVKGIASDATKALQSWIKAQIEPKPAKP